nr:NAD-binding protein [uncultured Phascolarctobacterium sp.]
MKKKQREKQYAVFGLGRFGTSVALTLNGLGYQVLGVDTDEDNVQNLAHELTHVVTADAADERTLRSLGVQNFDVAVVAIGDLEANMLTTLLFNHFSNVVY